MRFLAEFHCLSTLVTLFKLAVPFYHLNNLHNIFVIMFIVKLRDTTKVGIAVITKSVLLLLRSNQLLWNSLSIRFQ